MVLAKSSPNTRFWRDQQGNVLTLDVVDKRSSPLSAKSKPEGENEKHLSRTVSRAIAKRFRRYRRAQRQVNSVGLASVREISESIKSANVSSVLTDEEKRLMLELLEENKDLFTVDVRTTTPLVKHDIITDGQPIKQQPYRIPHSEKQYVHDYIQDGLKSGIIRPSNSPWSSPILLVAKKDGTKRFCVDYRLLNAATKKDIYPIPLVDDVIEKLAGMKYFSKLDLITSYYQIEVEEDAKEKTAFITEEGSFEYNVMPFGLTNAPSTFQRLMNLVLAGINHQMCLVYIDDILIFSQTFAQHLSDLRSVFARLRAANLKLKMSKCEFGANKTVYLGHTISSTGVATDPEKIDKIKKWEPEHLLNIEKVRSFLGLTGYYRKFIKNYADITAPLSNLLRKEQEFVIGDSVRQSFVALRNAVIDAPVLAYPRWDVEFVIQCDASNQGLGAVLSQYYDEEEHPIAYYSRRFNGAEEKYSIMERECLAIVESIKHFRPYVFGYKFTVMTDHKPLEHMDSFKAHNGRVARWKMALADYNFDVVTRPGTQNGNADGLSRFFVNSVQVQPKIERFGTKFPGAKKPKKMRRYQMEDEYYAAIFAYLEQGGRTLSRTTTLKIAQIDRETPPSNPNENATSHSQRSPRRRTRSPSRHSPHVRTYRCKLLLAWTIPRRIRSRQQLR
jgi:hypothetical protein